MTCNAQEIFERSLLMHPNKPWLVVLALKKKKHKQNPKEFTVYGSYRHINTKVSIYRLHLWMGKSSYNNDNRKENIASKYSINVNFF